jgi:hypothetical protein
MRHPINSVGLLPVLLLAGCSDSTQRVELTVQRVELTVFDDRSLFDSVVGLDRVVEDFESFLPGEVCPTTDPPRTIPCELITNTITYTSTKSIEFEGEEGARLAIGNIGASIFGNGIFVSLPIPGELDDFFLTLDSDFLGFDVVSSGNPNPSLPAVEVTVEVTEADGTVTTLTLPTGPHEGSFLGLESNIGIVRVSIWDDPGDGRQSNFCVDNVSVQSAEAG